MTENRSCWYCQHCDYGDEADDTEPCCTVSPTEITDGTQAVKTFRVEDIGGGVQ